MTEPKFKVGDVVHLRSGGPTMTILKVDLETFTCNAAWFDFRTVELRTAFLPENALFACDGTDCGAGRPNGTRAAETPIQ